MRETRYETLKSRDHLKERVKVAQASTRTKDPTSSYNTSLSVICSIGGSQAVNILQALYFLPTSYKFVLIDLGAEDLAIYSEFLQNFELGDRVSFGSSELMGFYTAAVTFGNPDPERFAGLKQIIINPSSRKNLVLGSAYTLVSLKPEALASAILYYAKGGV